MEDNTITSLCFAEDIDGLAGGKEEVANICELDTTLTRYGTDISAGKTKIMSNSSQTNQQGHHSKRTETQRKSSSSSISVPSLVKRV